MSTDSPGRILTAEEIANYVVCPEAWRLKYVMHAHKTPAQHSTEGAVRKQAWTKRQDLSRQLSSYAKIAYLLLVALVIIVFLLDQQRAGGLIGSFSAKNPTVTKSAQDDAAQHDESAVRDGRAPKTVPPEIFQLLLVLGLLIFMWDLFERRSRKLKRESGLSEQSEMVAAKGSSRLAARSLLSESLGISSKPDAIVKDGSAVIPVAVHPLTNKVRDRHVIPMLVHLCLLEETSGRRPPYGVLVMGRKERRVQIANTEEKQRWLESLVDEMRSILDGVPAVPAPNVPKCKHCDVRTVCKYSAYSE